MKTNRILLLLLTVALAATAVAAGPAKIKRGPASNPLYIVNGIEVEDLTYFDLQSIEQLTILSDSTSVARYGERGYNGVMLVKLRYLRDTIITPRDQAPYLIAQTMPQFRSDTTTFHEWMSSQIRYPRKAVRGDIDGPVSVAFIVEKDGRIRFCRVLSAPDKSLAREAARILRRSPAWAPGIYNGKPVRVKLNITVDFRIPGKHYTPVMRIR